MKPFIVAIIGLFAAQIGSAEPLSSNLPEISAEPNSANVLVIYGSTEQVIQVISDFKESETCLLAGIKVMEAPVHFPKHYLPEFQPDSSVALKDNDWNGLTNDFMGWNFAGSGWGLGSPDLPSAVMDILQGLVRLDLSGMDPVGHAYLPMSSETETCWILWPMTDDQGKGFEFMATSGQKLVGSNWLQIPTTTHILVPEDRISAFESMESKAMDRARRQDRVRLYGY